MRTTVYPLHDSLFNTLNADDAVSKALRLVRSLAYRLGTGETEIEILLYLSMMQKPCLLGEVSNHVFHLPEEDVKTLLHAMAEDSLIDLVSSDNDEGQHYAYAIKPTIARVIKAVDKVSLESYPALINPFMEK